MASTTVAIVLEMDFGVDDETIESSASASCFASANRQGGAEVDYVQWALGVPGATRAWCYPLEMGMGTVTVRFMMDNLRADEDGFPRQGDVATETEALDKVARSRSRTMLSSLRIRTVKYPDRASRPRHAIR